MADACKFAVAGLRHEPRVRDGIERRADLTLAVVSSNGVDDMSMLKEISPEPVQSKSNEAFVSAIASETETPIEQVRALYEEELAALTKRATVRQFVGVIATKRVKQHLRASRAKLVARGQ